ncbi:hypothetical protein [Alteribacillus iranensis]|nr:hypothetical protein [Alteribacillus iranensis]
MNIEERVTVDTDEKTVLTKEDIDRLLEEIELWLDVRQKNKREKV